MRDSQIHRVKAKLHEDKMSKVTSYQRRLFGQAKVFKEAPESCKDSGSEGTTASDKPDDIKYSSNDDNNNKINPIWKYSLILYVYDLFN